MDHVWSGANAKQGPKGESRQTNDGEWVSTLAEELQSMNSIVGSAKFTKAFIIAAPSLLPVAVAERSPNSKWHQQDPSAAS